MACVKSQGNKSTELKFIAILKSRSISGWRRQSKILGKPDFVFPKNKIAVFIDGCFWHGCPKHCRMPATNVQYWTQKIEGNAKRDRQVTKGLKKKGWIVIRFWEHELKGCASLSRKLNRIKNIISEGMDKA
jgi:DNA mismatch endonuclease, patch repair protein